MNGSIKMIDSLVEQLNNAKLDGNTGESLLAVYSFAVSTQNSLTVQRSLSPLPQSTYSTSNPSSRPHYRYPPRTASQPHLEHSLVKSLPTNLKMPISIGSSLVIPNDDPCLAIPTSLSLKR
jgi:hypothetical protein